MTKTIHVKNYETLEAFKKELVKKLEEKAGFKGDIFDLIDEALGEIDEEVSSMESDSHLLYNPVVEDISDELEEVEHNLLLGAFSINGQNSFYGVLADTDSDHGPYGYLVLYIDKDDNLRGHVPRLGNSLNGLTCLSLFDEEEDNPIEESNNEYAQFLGYEDFEDFLSTTKPFHICMRSIQNELLSVSDN